MSIKPIFGTVDELKTDLDNLSVEDLQRELAETDNLLLVDIREIQEYVDLGTIPGAVHAPRGMLEFWADPASPYYRDFFTEDKRIVVFCAGGGRSAFAAKALKDMGFADVGHLEPGFTGWSKAGGDILPTVEKSRWIRKPKEERPPLWIGHCRLRVTDVAASHQFFLNIGMRDIPLDEADFAILEMRGGTHLILQPEKEDAQAGDATFDLMVEDVDAAHAQMQEAGGEVSEISRGEIHDRFTVTEPGGNRIVVNSSHVTDLPV